MKVISRDGAIGGIQFLADEVKPLGGYYIPALVRGITERYGFTKAPTYEEARTSGATFYDGRHTDGKREIAIGRLAIFVDAIVATTTDTDDSELVVHDLFAWLQKTFKFRKPITAPVQVFQSDLIVEFKNDPSSKFGALAPLMQFLQKGMEKTASLRKPVQFSRIAFAADGHTHEFLVERRAGTPWTLNRYYCKAHLPTSTHVRALELLDELIG